MSEGSSPPVALAPSPDGASKVVSLVQARDAPADQAVVQLLQEVLQEAEAGNLRAVVIVGIDKQDIPRKGFAGDIILSRVIGLLECCKHVLLQANDQLGGMWGDEGD